jgi:hypothetical protein
MVKMSIMSKMSKCGMGMGMGMGNGLIMNVVMLVAYLVVAYVLYQVVMYFVGQRSSAMPNIPSSAGRMSGGCASGTCGANNAKKEGMMNRLSPHDM